MRFSWLGLTLVFTLFACGPRPSEPNQYQKNSFYPQDLSSPVALFVRERNGGPFILASAFLIDKQRGIFASAKHFVGNESDGRCQIFFNGRVYKGFLVTEPEVTDAVAIKIDGPFDSQTFPEPYPLAAGVRKGERVFIQGIHPHPSRFQVNQKIIPIFSQYYGIVGKGDEFVFDNLEAEVVDTSRKIENSTIKDSSEILANISGIYVELKAKEDHGFSFSGLSGGPTINERQELIGINAVENPAYWELNREGLAYHPWVTLNLVPVEEVRKLVSKLSSLK